MLSKKILKEEISKTKSTIKTLEKLRIDSAEKGLQIDTDCSIGLDVNSFVLLKLEEELKNL